jgi:hypothetical protein
MDSSFCAMGFALSHNGISKKQSAMAINSATKIPN